MKSLERVGLVLDFMSVEDGPVDGYCYDVHNEGCFEENVDCGFESRALLDVGLSRCFDRHQLERQRREQRLVRKLGRDVEHRLSQLPEDEDERDDAEHQE